MTDLTPGQLWAMGLISTVEYDALAAAWHPVPPCPHPDSVGILLVAAKSMRDELLAALAEKDAEIGRLRREAETHLLVLGSISQWIDRLPDGFKAAIREGQELSKEDDRREDR